MGSMSIGQGGSSPVPQTLRDVGRRHVRYIFRLGDGGFASKSRGRLQPVGISVPHSLEELPGALHEDQLVDGILILARNLTDQFTSSIGYLIAKDRLVGTGRHLEGTDELFLAQILDVGLTLLRHVDPHPSIVDEGRRGGIVIV
jgi:hypothetical protein